MSTTSTTYLNAVPSIPLSRQPRAQVYIGTTIDQNQAAAGWIDWTVQNNSFYQADTFRVTFAVNKLKAPFDLAFFATTIEAFVEIFVGFPPDPMNVTSDGMTSLILGRIDDIDYDPVATTITIHGRDLAACFIDNKTTSRWTNLPPEQIAVQLADAHGLDCEYSDTDTIAGKFYLTDHVQINLERSEWDLLANLAAFVGFVCYVSGNTLFFVEDPRPTSTPYLLQWQTPQQNNKAFPTSNMLVSQDIHLTRSLTIAKGVTVEVRSWNSKQKKGFNAFYPSKPKALAPGKSSPFGNTQTYLHVESGLTQDQAQQKAQALYNVIVAHELKIQAGLPGDNLLFPRNLITLTGTGTAWDQSYYPDQVTREFSLDAGYRMHVTAKNHSPDLTQI